MSIFLERCVELASPTSKDTKGPLTFHVAAEQGGSTRRNISLVYVSVIAAPDTSVCGELGRPADEPWSKVVHSRVSSLSRAASPGLTVAEIVQYGEPRRRGVSLANLKPPVARAAIMLVASPRNQLYLDQEVAGIWRPLAACGRAQHSRQVALQCDLQLIAVGFEQGDLDQRTDGVHGARAAFVALQRATGGSRPSDDGRPPCAGVA